MENIIKRAIEGGYVNNYTTSEEAKEKWEDDLGVLLFSSIAILGTDMLPDRTQEKDLSVDKNAIIDFIRKQRSLAQQEILDRVSERLEGMSYKLPFKREEGKIGFEFLDGHEKCRIQVKELLSTLKDTNI